MRTLCCLEAVCAWFDERNKKVGPNYVMIDKKGDSFELMTAQNFKDNWNHLGCVCPGCESDSNDRIRFVRYWMNEYEEIPFYEHA